MYILSAQNVVLLFALGTLGACAGAPTAPDRVEKPETIVLTDGTTTYHIASTGTEHEILGQFSGVVLGHNNHLWMYNIAESKEPEADCSCVMEAEMQGQDAQKCVSVKTKPRAVLTRLSDSQLVYPFEIRSSEETASDYTFQLLGQTRSTVFMEMCGDQYACGAAHPWHECQAVAFDLVTGKFSSVDQIVGDVNPEEARVQIQQHDPEFEGELQVVAAKVLLDDGKAQVNALMSGPTCYACSDGQWSSYTNSGWSKTTMQEDLPLAVVSFFKNQAHLPLHWLRVTEDNRTPVQAIFATELSH